MIQKIYNDPEIWSILVPIPDNPLRSLNSYVVMNDERPLVIDTGFNRAECRDAMTQGLAELGLRMEDCALFITHIHSDHCGLASLFAGAGAPIIMGRRDWQLLSENLSGGGWQAVESVYREHGYPAEDIMKQSKGNQARLYAADGPFPAKLVDDGHVFTLGGCSFRCVETPGHSPGHMCLYMERERLLFCGDHVLYTITPNISRWAVCDTSLRDYLQSLDKIAELDVVRAFPAHRAEGAFHERIGQLKAHHAARLRELEAALKTKPEQAAYELAQQLTWSNRGRPWSEFSPTQKWFAVGETIAHLDYLVWAGRTEYVRINDLVYAHWTGRDE